jgi:hypothetical protein
MDTIEEAKLLAERIEKGNAELKTLLDRQDKARADDILHGRSEAGIPDVPVDPEEAKKQRASDFFKGTVIDGMIK